ncbi:hypothetical protein AQ490_01300 [Wenjunlia vitaminophila]|uniref:DUF3093 domain-containing protein n=1 Tax=Wenjunlia vitaminophila TaxID=76728 RepID=A0A0T6LZA8_WENVI|nr:DUF3093 domain-containing protein [Wenjunlia vitaminophila]KRV51527.1 hypothetical protein AQ490_01300 [Wenjunlia vitaminophila]
MQSYEERLTVSRSWWVIALVTGACLGLVVLPLGTVPALLGLVGGVVAAAVAVSAYGSARIRVVQGSLVAGPARVPAYALGEAQALDPQEATAWRSHRADPRAFMLLRAYIPTAVRVEIVDPEDPTPYLYLSTRHPERLVAALGKAPDA